MKFKKRTAIIFSIALLLAISMYFLSKKNYSLLKTYPSPNSNYSLEVYKEKNYKPLISLASESGFARAYVVLKDAQSNIILKPSWYAPCKFRVGDLNVDWQINQNRIYFTKFNYIDLKNNSFSCI